MKFRQLGYTKMFVFFILFLSILACKDNNVKQIRKYTRLDEGWVSVVADSIVPMYEDFQSLSFIPKGWDSVRVPHNWDQYYGYRRLIHGNKHGTALYRRFFSIPKIENGKRFFLFFEGVGSYATVWVNGKLVGSHAGGRTTFTIDITEAIVEGDKNLLAVKADGPKNIRDLPWVCGGCSPEWGFSEGSQPLGIFRPVHLIETSEVRVTPFGVHIWNDTLVTSKMANVFASVEIHNYSKNDRLVRIENSILDSKNCLVSSQWKDTLLNAGKTILVHFAFNIQNPVLWSLDNPFLYFLNTSVIEEGKTLDEVSNTFGVRSIKWNRDPNGTGQLFLNGEPVFINGTCEYEHLMGRSHSFSDQMVTARAQQILAAGFNAFRDAHQPHNLRYNKIWDEKGILWWPQMSAHIWFDNPKFKENFKKLLREFVRERRNSPSLILWGLQNESKLPEDFARECTNIIREMDPTSPSQRLVVTCNGGTGTDWNVIQNWSGTYGGNPQKYDDDLKRQKLNGEYGAWRSIDFHNEGEFQQGGPYTEDQMTLLLEMKMRLGKEAAGKSSGHFQWLFASHENPGRIQSGEGIRELDRVGPVNYKGLYTIWGEPVDAYYMYRANNVSANISPMVYIDSHTWPDRYTFPGIKSGIKVFSNCEEVELFNDIGSLSLGRKKNPGYGHHFVWNRVNIKFNTLHAVGFMNGKPVAEDIVIFNHLPEAPGLNALRPSKDKILAPLKGCYYLYRVNCGGDDYTDEYGNLWYADVKWRGKGSWGSLNWTDDFEHLPPFYASQRRTNDPILGTKAWELFQSFRYGMNRLRYRFPVPNGKYNVELFFIEPWYGTGGGMDCSGWRKFDVAINGETYIKGMDIWKEVGHDHALKKTLVVNVTKGQLEISFPNVDAGQAVISAIAISSAKKIPKEKLAKGISLIQNVDNLNCRHKHWMNTGVQQYLNSTAKISCLPPELYGAEWLCFNKDWKEFPSWGSWLSFNICSDAWIYLIIDNVNEKPFKWMDEQWIKIESELCSTIGGGHKFSVWKKFFSDKSKVILGGNENGYMYTVAVKPHNEMVEPIDMRPTTIYQAEAGSFFNGCKKVEKLGKLCAMMDKSGATIEWTFSVGLASRYGLEFRYINRSNKEIPLHMEIVSSDGTIEWGGDIVFPASGNKWRSRKTDTQTSINAGTYKLRLSTIKPSEFYIDWIKIQ